MICTNVFANETIERPIVTNDWNEANGKKRDEANEKKRTTA